MRKRTRRGKDLKEKAAQLWQHYLVLGSIRAVHQATGVPATTIKRLLNKYIGEDYAYKARRSLYRDIKQTQYGCYQEEVDTWLEMNVDKLASLDAEGNDFFSESYINNELIRRSQKFRFLEDHYYNEIYGHGRVDSDRGRYEQLD